MFYLTTPRRILYSSSANEANGCSRSQLWDPFSNICRTVFCQSEFDLAEFDFQCDAANFSDYDVPTILPR